MPIKPEPIKLTCASCKWHKIVAPKSDVVPAEYLFTVCPSCGQKLERKVVSSFEATLKTLFS